MGQPTVFPCVLVSLLPQLTVFHKIGVSSHNSNKVNRSLFGLHGSMNALHGLSTGSHGLHSLEVDVGVLDGHDLSFYCETGARNLFNLALELLLAL